MNSPTMFDQRGLMQERDHVAIRLENISVRYRVPHERVTTLKEHAIRVLQRRIQFDDFWALHKVSAEVRQGEVVGIIGRNGAGKSTLLKVISRVLRPTEGRVWIQGRVAPLLEFSAGFHPELTGRENVFLNGALLGFSRANMLAKFQSIVDFAELAEFIDAPLRTYSSGMIARLGFAIATDVDPDILVVDEIFGVGDAEFQWKSADRINDFRKGGVTILLVSHDLDAIRNICAKSIWLDNGRIVACGPTDQVVEAYLARATTREEARLVEQQRRSAVDRWGSGEVRIVDVRFLDANGNTCHTFASGSSLTARIRYHATQRIKKPMFGVAIYRSDGIHINGPNTRFSDFDIDWIEGDGEVDYVIERLPLLEGSYDFSVSIYDYDGIHPYDHLHRVYKFLIQRGSAKERYGLVQIPAHWEHHKL